MTASRGNIYINVVACKPTGSQQSNCLFISVCVVCAIQPSQQLSQQLSQLMSSCHKLLNSEFTSTEIGLHQRCADCGRGSANKHICGRGPSADLKPRVLFAGPTSNGSGNVPVLSNLRTDPYLDTVVGYVRKPV